MQNREAEIIGLNVKVLTLMETRIREELSVDVSVGRPYYVFDYDDSRNKTQTFEIAYFAVLEGENSSIRSNLKDHSELIWVTKELVDSLEMTEQERKAIILGFEMTEGE